MNREPAGTLKLQKHGETKQRYSGMAKIVERIAVTRMKAEMEATGWKLDPAFMGGLPGRGVDDAAHSLGVLL